MGKRDFANRWDAIARRTGMFHLNRRDLRRTAVVLLSGAECITAQIASITQRRNLSKFTGGAATRRIDSEIRIDARCPVELVLRGSTEPRR